MPIVDIQIVAAPDTELPGALAAQLADALGTVFQAGPGRVWVRLQRLAESGYAENATTERVRPVFVRVLHADLPAPAALAAQAAAVAAAVAACLPCAASQVHVEYAPAGRGRMAFGGQLLQ